MSKWKYRMDFIGMAEAMYQKDKLDFQGMAKKIIDGFVKNKWIKKTDVDLFPNLTDRKAIEDEELVELYDIIMGTLHSIAYMDEIYGEETEFLPTVDDYDYWKTELYDWADRNKVWIMPSYGVEV